MRVMLGVMLLIAVGGVSSGNDPFLNKQNAVGYVVVGENGKRERFVVIEAADGSVRLIKASSKEDTQDNTLDVKVLEEEGDE